MGIGIGSDFSSTSGIAIFFQDTQTYYQAMDEYQEETGETLLPVQIVVANELAIQRENVENRYYGTPDIPLSSDLAPWYYCLKGMRGSRQPIGYCANRCPGHLTSAEACAHFAQYLRDCLVMGVCFAHVTVEQSCVVCGRETTGYGRVASDYYTMMWHLCDIHRTPRTLRDHFYCEVTPNHITMGFTSLKRKRK